VRTLLGHAEKLGDLNESKGCGMTIERAFDLFDLDRYKENAG
jgi:hypothetical protein